MNEKNTSILFKILDQSFVLDPRRVIYWEENDTLILSDLHLGKAGHFRKAGIPVPASIHLSDLNILQTCLNDYQPTSVIFLGDLFHSDHNEEWTFFENWLKTNLSVGFILVKGNHDILDERLYHSANLRVVDSLRSGPFYFSHEEEESDLYNLSGHIHPGVRIKTGARQGVTLSCFYFSSNSGLLPAFGQFTGNYMIKPKKGSSVFAIAGDQIVAMEG